jgi:hypothetical protein
MFYRRIWNIVGKYSILCCDTLVFGVEGDVSVVLSDKCVVRYTRVHGVLFNHRVRQESCIILGFALLARACPIQNITGRCQRTLL